MAANVANVDAYINKAPEYARPILTKFRALMHKACPGIEESIKWSAPCFEHCGMLAGMAAFKQHVALRFWRGKQLPDPKGLMQGEKSNEMGTIKVGDVSELPADSVLIKYIKAAAKHNEQLAKGRTETAKARKRGDIPKAKKQPAKKVTVPPDFAAALAKKKKALATFDGFSYSHRKEYVEWITEAKRDETRQRRIKQAVEWLAEGKPRNWKYVNC
ncbi:MAG: YdeI/OmpD-associated family protein [Phycisphaerales bacterium]|nr:YdeI/OmpD-associated family protein [Phycisphaerales bacterium]